MANTYGDDTEPGIITEETSADNIVQSTEAPSDVCIVGPADLTNASNAASPNTVHEITRASTATRRFGPADSSLLTAAVHDALREGAQPVYALTPTATDVVDEDYSDAGETTVTLDNGPTSEDADDFEVSLDDTDLSVNVVYEDVSGFTPGEGECYVNPVDAEIEVPSAPSTSLDVSYTHFDYVAALDALEANREAAEAIDFLLAVQENAAVQQDVVETAKNLSAEQQYTVALVAPNAARIDPDNYTNSYDSSRVQVEYPTRFTDNTSALAAYAGKRADLGLDRTPINQRLTTDKELAVRLSREQRGALIAECVVPLQDRAGGAIIKDDKTAVTSENSDEKHINFGFKRLVLDYVYATTEANEEPFIGRLNQPHVRAALADLIAYQLTALKSSNLIEGYSVGIYGNSSTSARLELNVVAPDPLRFIENDVTVGSSS